MTNHRSRSTLRKIDAGFCFLVLLGLVTVSEPQQTVAQKTAPATSKVTLLPKQEEPKKSDDSSSGEPIPTVNASDELKKIIGDGNVKVEYDSEGEFAKSGRGWADFHLQEDRKYRFDLQKQKRQGRWQVRITVSNVEEKIMLTHIVRMPAQKKSPDIWESWLLKHEFDHVAISLDPRPKILLIHLLKTLPPIERTLDAGEEPTNDVIKRLINEQLDKRAKSIRDVMIHNNQTLDNISHHGTAPIPKRADFFRSLYTKDNLAQARFPYLENVLKVLDSPDYQNAELRYLPSDPAEDVEAKSPDRR